VPRFEVQHQVSTTILGAWNADVIELEEYLPKITEEVGNILYQGIVLEGFKYDPPFCGACK
jgi:hypothetical protein